jgi:hypothetical protein
MGEAMKTGRKSVKKKKRRKETQELTVLDFCKLMSLKSET